MHKALLNIYPEGELLRQTETILEELHIIRHIKEQQQRVSKEYLENAAYLLLPELSRLKDSPTNPIEIMEALDWQEGLTPEQRAAGKWTHYGAEDFEIFFADQFAQLNNLYLAAEHTSQAVRPTFPQEF
jgi:hypothetical protein